MKCPSTYQACLIVTAEDMVGMVVTRKKGVHRTLYLQMTTTILEVWVSKWVGLAKTYMKNHRQIIHIFKYPIQEWEWRHGVSEIWRVCQSRSNSAARWTNCKWSTLMGVQDEQPSKIGARSKKQSTQPINSNNCLVWHGSKKPSEVTPKLQGMGQENRCDVSIKGNQENSIYGR